MPTLCLIGATVVLLVFYLYLLVRPQHVKRKSCYLAGAAGLLLALIGVLLVACDARTVGGIFDWAGAVVAFLAAIAACYGGTLPGVDKMEHRMTERLEKPDQSS